MVLPTNLSGPQTDADNRAWHAEIKAALPALNLADPVQGTNGHLAAHATLNAYVNAQTGSSLPTNPAEGDPNHELHHNTIHAYVNGLADPGNFASFNTLYGASPTGEVVITQPVLLDVNATVDALTIAAGGTLQFDQTQTRTLQSRGNVIVRGTLRMRPNAATITHTLRIINANEEGYVGGGMTVVPSDLGVWIDDGILDAVGTMRNPWTRATGSIAAGATQITVQDATGWRVGDAIAITPTEPTSVGTMFWDGYDERTISAISGNTITLSSGTTRAHPAVSFQTYNFPAEVLNLTRNVVIEGTASGRVHVAWVGHAVPPHHLAYVHFRHLGPRAIHDHVHGRGVTVTAVNTTADSLTAVNHGFVAGDRVRIANSTANNGSGLPAPLAIGTTYFVVGATADTFQLAATSGGAPINLTTVGTGSNMVRLLHATKNDKGKIVGRWPVHFHHNHGSTFGSTMVGLLATQNGSHSFVSHATHGITWTRCVAHDVTEAAFWWDTREGPGAPLEPGSNDIIYEHCVASRIKIEGPAEAVHSLQGYLLAHGERLTIRDCIAVGVQGSTTAAGYLWSSHVNGAPAKLWIFQRNIGHNCRISGLRAWQNENELHVIEDSQFYRNGENGIDHGAYANRYRYINCTSYDNGLTGFQSHGQSTSLGRHIVENCTFEGGPYAFYVPHHKLTGGQVAEVKNCKFLNYTVAGIWVPYDWTATSSGMDQYLIIDPVFSGAESTWFRFASNIHPDAYFEVKFTGGAHYVLRRADWPTGTLVTAWNAKRINL